MGFRYVPEDMIRRSDFASVAASYPPETQRRIRRAVGRLIRENPEYTLPLLAGPGYLMMHYLMSDLYVSLAIYLVRRKEGESGESLLRQIDECLTRSGRKLNRMMKRIMKLPGAFGIARRVMPRAMSLANGHGFSVTPVDYGRDGFGFDVTECPYSRLYTKYRVREIGPVLCRFDETLSEGIDSLAFVRRGTLCRGNEKCDFCYLRTKGENNR